MGLILGILQQSPDAYLKQGVGVAAISEVEIERLVQRRKMARAGRDFAESDRIRDLLATAGILLEDKPGGTTGWRRS